MRRMISPRRPRIRPITGQWETGWTREWTGIATVHLLAILNPESEFPGHFDLFDRNTHIRLNRSIAVPYGFLTIIADQNLDERTVRAGQSGTVTVQFVGSFSTTPCRIMAP